MKKSDPIVIAVDAAYNIVDGIDGWISETGDFPSNFWKKDVLDRYDRVSDAVNKSAGKVLHPRDQIKLKKKAEDLLDDLIDGLEGVVSEQGEVPDRYWKRNALSKGKTVLRALKRASRVSSLQPLRSRHDYGEDDEKVARELVAVARELTARDDDLNDFAKEVAKEAGREWELDNVGRDSFTLEGKLSQGGHRSPQNPVITATINILKRGATEVEIEAFDDDEDYETRDSTSWKAVPSDPAMRPKLVRAIGKFLDRFIRQM